MDNTNKPATPIPPAPKSITPSSDLQKLRVSHKDGVWLLVIVAILAAAGIFYYLLLNDKIPVRNLDTILTEKFTRAVIFSFIIVLIAKSVNIFIVNRLRDVSAGYNLRYVIRLVAFLLIAIVIVSIIFVNWYAAAVSLGLISLVLGFALQTPILSFIGWIYILIRRPYIVGDRIKINDVKGDVIEVNYLDTTLWEFGGEYLSTDHPSGRLIKFPNAKVLDSVIHNYSWELFPYIWSEVKVFVAYNSDLNFVSETMKEVAGRLLGKEMSIRIKAYCELLSDTPVDQLDVKEKPQVIFLVHDNTWIEVVLRFLVSPKEAGYTKSAIVKEVLEALNKAPEKVLFPKGENR